MEYTKFFNFIEIYLGCVSLMVILSHLLEKGLIGYYRKIKKVHHRDKVYENIKNLFIGYNAVVINIFYILVVVYIPVVILRLINYFI